MATPNRFAIRDSGKATFYSLTGSKGVIVTLPTLKTSGVETTGETVYSRGGYGNSKLVGFSSNREAKIMLEDALFDTKAIAMLTGNEPVVGTKTIPINGELQSALSQSVTLDNTPVGALVSVHEVNPDGTNGTLYTLGDPGANETEFSISGKVVTFHSSVSNGKAFNFYYHAETDATATTIKVTADAFGGTFKIVLDVLVRDAYTKADFAGKLIIPNGKFEDNFDFSFSADGDPATLNLPVEILKDPVSTTMWEMVIHDPSLIL